MSINLREIWKASILLVLVKETAAISARNQAE